MTQRPTREFILSEIRRLAASAPDGRLGRGRFTKATGITMNECSRHWATWSEAVADAGVTPNTLTQPLDRDELLRQLAEVTRALGRVPTYNHLRVEWNKREGFPAPQTFQVRFGTKANLVTSLRKWVADHDDFADIAPMLVTASATTVAEAEPEEAAHDELPATFSESYIPPIVACLPALARMESELPIEFERRVAVAFELLGLEVQRLGQGSGREPDGIAKCRPHGWAVIYDAKATANVYRIRATEERKFREYIERYTRELRGEGMTRLYFAIIGSTFSVSDLARARELVLGTDVKSVALMEAPALVALIAQHLRSPLRFGPPEYERAFSETRIVREGSSSPTARA